MLGSATPSSRGLGYAREMPTEACPVARGIPQYHTCLQRVLGSADSDAEIKGREVHPIMERSSNANDEKCRGEERIEEVTWYQKKAR